MPTKKPTMSWNEVRNMTEKFEWRDPRTGIVTRGYNPPGGKDGRGVKRVPFHIRYISGKGCVEDARSCRECALYKVLESALPLDNYDSLSCPYSRSEWE